MVDSNTSTDGILQICLGIFAVLSLVAAIAGLHTRNSLGAAGWRAIRRQLHRNSLRSTGTLEEEDEHTAVRVDDEETLFGLLGLDSIDIPSSRISFDNATFQTANDRSLGAPSSGFQDFLGIR
jgi:hypothetical protein